jgi:predicted metal-dependent peptidase
MTLHERMTACAIDIMAHPEFALVGGLLVMGKRELDEKYVTAATDGLNMYFAPSFIEPQSREQLRYIMLHEALHIGLRHCVTYPEVCKKYPQLSNMAMDYVVNGFIEECEPTRKWAAHPTSVKPLLDPKYFGMSFLEVLHDLKQNAKQQPQSGHGEGEGDSYGGEGQPMDGHIVSDGNGGEGAAKGTLTEQQIKEISQAVDDAMRQGAIAAQKIAGRGKGNNPLEKSLNKRDTNWKQHLREFFEQIIQGDEYSRFCPPNKRMLASGFIMPSHFDLATGEVVIACDTSGSMYGVLPVVFGEIAQICTNLKPEKVRVIWWSDGIEGEQVFLPHEYEKIAQLVKPVGGGGTRVSCVAEYIREQSYKPKATIILTDGWIESSYEAPEGQLLWGVVDNDHFVPSKGKAVRIYSEVSV